MCNSTLLVNKATQCIIGNEHGIRSDVMICDFIENMVMFIKLPIMACHVCIVLYAKSCQHFFFYILLAIKSIKTENIKVCTHQQLICNAMGKVGT